MDEDRLKHSLSVARKMMEIGKKYNLNESELQDLFLLGYNHDIGYEFGEHTIHGQIGGNILKQNNYKYWREIYYHGMVQSEYSSLYLDILNQADMQIDKYGNEVGYENRLKEIENRYGKESKTYLDAKKLIEGLEKE